MIKTVLLIVSIVVTNVLIGQNVDKMKWLNEPSYGRMTTSRVLED